MPVKPWTQQERQDRVRAAIEAVERETPPDPEYVNSREALALDRPVVKVICGRPYIVRPIPYEYGLELHDLLLTYHKPNSGTQETRRVLRGMVRLFAKLARPVGVRRWIRWLLPNPFRNASEREIIATADFFWACRTGTPFRALIRHAAENARRSTGRTDGRSSPGASRRGSNGGGGGAGVTGSRSPGDITSSE